MVRSPGRSVIGPSDPNLSDVACSIPLRSGRSTAAKLYVLVGYPEVIHFIRYSDCPETGLCPSLAFSVVSNLH